MTSMPGRISYIIFLGVWALLSARVGSLILPSPLEVAHVFKEEILTLGGLAETWETLGRFIYSYTLSVTSGVLMGVAAFRYRGIRNGIWPVITSLQATPVISWILLALLWFSSGFIPFFVLWVFIFPIITINMYEGLASTDEKLIEMARVYKFSRRDTFSKIYFPSALPYLRAGMKISANSALKVLVTAEIVGRLPGGMGSSMNNAWMNIDTASLLAWTIYLVLLTNIVEGSISTAMSKTFRRYL